MYPLRQSTAGQEIPIGPLVDDTDGKTAETGLTVANTNIKIHKNGTTTLANKNSGGGTHISDGVYYAVLDATDTDTAGPLVIFVIVSGALYAKIEAVVYPQTIYDALFAGTDTLPVDVTQVAGSAVSGIADFRADVSNLDVAVSTRLASAGYTTPPTAVAIRQEIDSNSTQLAAILADTNELQTDDLPGLITALNDLDAAGVAGAVWNAATAAYGSAGSYGQLVETNLDAAVSSRLAAAGYTAPDNAGITTLLGRLTATRAGYIDALNGHIAQTGDVFAALPANFADLAITATTGRVTAGTVIDKAGYSLSGTITTLDALDTAQDAQHAQTQADIAALNNLSSADVTAAVPSAAQIRAEIDANSTQLAAILADTNELQTDNVPGLIAALNDISPAEVNAQVDAAIETYHLDHLLAAAYDPATKPGNAGALLNVLVENDGGVPRYTANALEQAPAGGGGTADWTTDEKSQIRHRLGLDGTAAAPSSGTPNLGVVAANLTQILGTAISETSSGRIAGNWDLFWDNSDAQTTKIVNDVGVAGAGLTAQQVWEYNISGISTAGQAGKIVNDILADTNELQSDNVPGLIAALNDLSSADVTAAVPSAAQIRAEIDSNSTQLAAILADTNELQTDDLPGLIAALNDLDAAGVAAAVWNAATAAHGAAGSYGLLVEANLDAAISSRLAAAGYTAPDNAGISANGAAIAALNDLSQAEVETAVANRLEAAIGASPTAGSINERLKTLDDNYTAARSAGLDNLDAAISSRFAAGSYTAPDNAGIAAVKAKTDQLAFSSGDVVATLSGEQVTVGDIVAAALAKFISIDTGESAAADGSVAKISQGAAGGNVTVGAFTAAALAEMATIDTGETAAADGSVAKLAQGSGGGATPAEIWGYASRTLTQTAVQIQAAVSGGDITVYRATDWDFTLTGLGALSSYDKIYLTVKSSAVLPDSEAVLQLRTGANGLLAIDGGSPAAAGNGSLAITDAVTGSIRAIVDVVETAGADNGVYDYDVKGITAAGVVQILAVGEFVIKRPITQATT